MKGETAVSIIVPVYNLEKYIGDCIDSILNQSFKNYELILVDDFSTDNTREIVKEYIDNYKEDIILIENARNMGAGYSRNRGLDIAKGKYLLFLDGDDFFEYNMLEKVYCPCEEKEADVGIFNFNIFDDNTHDSFKHYDPIDMLQVVADSFRFSDIGDCAFQFVREIAWNKIFRREFIINEGIRFQCQNNANDQFFVYASLLKAKRIVKIPDYLLSYRTNRKGQLSTGSNISRYPLCIWNALKATLDFADMSGVYDLYKQSFNIYAVQRLIFSLNKGDMAERRELFDYYKEKGFEVLKLNNCHLHDFGIPFFYEMNRWLIHLESADELKEMAGWNLWNDENKCVQLLEELMNEDKIVLWGAGKNGDIFLEKANDKKLDIRYVVDMDKNKIGQAIHGHMITCYDDIDDGSLILATNPEHIFAIRHLMHQQGKRAYVFDVRAYLCFNITFDQAQIDPEDKKCIMR